MLGSSFELLFSFFACGKFVQLRLYWAAKETIFCQLHGYQNYNKPSGTQGRKEDVYYHNSFSGLRKKRKAGSRGRCMFVLDCNKPVQYRMDVSII